MRLPREALAYDGVLVSELAGRLAVPALHCYAQIGSTLDAAHARAPGATSGTLVIADEQTAGRGRQGRPWTSRPGGGVWLTLIDLRTGKVVAKALDRATVDSVNPEPLPFYRDSPTWHKDATIMGYINSCQVNTKIGDLADPDYLSRLPAAAVINEAILAYDDGKVPAAHRLYARLGFDRTPAYDWQPVPGLCLLGYALDLSSAAGPAGVRPPGPGAATRP